MNRYLAHVVSKAYAGALAAEHRADLQRSGLTEETIARQRIRSVPLHMLDLLAGFHLKARSAYLIPFADPAGGWMDHVKLRIFSDDEPTDVRGNHVEEHREKWRYNGGARKYVTRRLGEPRVFFPVQTIRQVLEGSDLVWCIEGEKKSLSAAQLGLAAVGLESAWGWHLKGSRALLPDFASIPLMGRIVELVPDSDVQTNPMIAHAMRRLAEALRAVGARPRLVKLPVIEGLKKTGMDDYLMRATAEAGA